MGLVRPDASYPRPRGRVLVISLQRLGDLLTAARVTGELSQRDEVDRVELLHFSPTDAAARLLPGVSRRHQLDYNALKQLRHLHVFAAPTRLREALGSVYDRRGFDSVVNLTSTGFAAALAPALLAKRGRCFGPALSERGELITHDPFSAYLNEIGTDPDLNVFAHQDLYAAAGTVDPGPGRLPLHDPEARREAIDALGSLARHATPPIAVHVHSSDIRKDWSNPMSFSGWRGLLNALARRQDGGVVLLGHPREAPVLQALAESCPGRAVAATCSLGATAELLQRCSGLISVDTVTIHLAALVRCRSVILRLGPAGGAAFVPGDGALVVDPRRDCHPCRQAQCDTEPKLACHRDLHVGDLAELAHAHLFDRPLSAFASRRIAARVRVRVCEHSRSGLRRLVTPTWFPAPVADQRVEASDDRWRCAWWSSFVEPGELDRSLVARLLSPESELEQRRLDRVLGLPSPLGAALRAASELRKVGA
ncbi:MAG: glycosyltransferase family 9 protein [Myxococcales bacterium FL481]|nr:MAG: glycosyltransferase family 9 protein [Myxococcales bacterium FL481]